jgi:hypothetical protein
MHPTSFDRDEALVAVRSYPGEELAAQQRVAAWLADNGLAPELQPTPNQQPNWRATTINITSGST